MGGSSKGQTTQTTTNAPPKWAEGLFKQSAGEAQKIYNSGSGGNVYQGQTVAQYSPTSMGGINALTQAGQGAPNYTNLEAQAGAPTAASNYLTDYASGKFLQEGNPYYKERLAGEIGDSNALLQSSFSGAGRYGSGANQNTLAKNTSNMMLQGLENDYNRQQANQFQAVGMMDNANTQSIQNQLGVGQAGFQNQLTGAGAQIDAGKMLDDKSQQNLQAEYAKWMGEDMKDWTRLGLLQSAAAGSAGNYGTQTGVMQQPGNPLSTIGGLGSLFLK
jgi:hypothetical protein